MRSVAHAIAACAAIAALLIGIVRGTYAAGGSDSSCYLNTARVFAGGAVRLDEPMARAAAWSNAVATFTPNGFNPSAVAPGAYVPICPPGLSAMMAAIRVLHASEFLVVPSLGALAAWLTFYLGRRIDRPLTGAAAAALLVSSPTFLYQVVQPMSDVPATAFWLLTLALALGSSDGHERPLLAGIAASIALWIRLNLLPLAAVVGAYMVFAYPRDRRLPGVTRFGVGMAPGLIALAWLQHAMYGSPFATGYGAGGPLMAAANIGPNLLRYPRWLVETHPFVLLALAGPACVRREPGSNRPTPVPGAAWLFLALSGATLACYLPLVVFDAWWYTRYLLPAIPFLAILSVVVAARRLERLVPRAAPLAGVACLVVATAFGIVVAREKRAFELAELEQHYRRAGTAVAERLPDRAAVVTGRNSGSVRYHAGLPTLSWETLPAGSLDDVLRFVRDRGYVPYLLFELDEETPFRQRFRGTSPMAELDWPPMLQVGRTIRIYDPADRARFMADGKTHTEFIR